MRLPAADQSLEVHRYGFASGTRRQGNRYGLSRIGNIARRAVTKEPHAAAGVVAPKVVGITAAAGIQLAGAIEAGTDAAAIEILTDDIDGREQAIVIADRPPTP